jgi:hypothetical protein
LVYKSTSSYDPIKTFVQSFDLHSLHPTSTRMAFKIRPFSLFKVQSVCLRKVGVWPGPENQALHRKHLARTALNLIIISIVLVFELNFAINSTDNLSAMMECLVLGITGIAAILKLAVYLLKHREFKEILETFDKLVTDGELNYSCQVLIRKFASTDTKSSSRLINNSMRKTELF